MHTDNAIGSNISRLSLASGSLGLGKWNQVGMGGIERLLYMGEGCAMGIKASWKGGSVEGCLRGEKRNSTAIPMGFWTDAGGGWPWHIKLGV